MDASCQHKVMDGVGESGGYMCSFRRRASLHEHTQTPVLFRAAIHSVSPLIVASFERYLEAHLALRTADTGYVSQ